MAVGVDVELVGVVGDGRCDADVDGEPRNAKAARPVAQTAHVVATATQPGMVTLSLGRGRERERER